MRTKTTFSVIVPVYQVEEFLPQCIESILAQTFTDFELLLIDDGSPDNCGAICDQYALTDDRIRVFHQANAGVSIARNTGLDHAIGDWICFVDSDDYVEENYLSAFFEHGHLDENCLNLQGWQIISTLNNKTIRSYSYPDLLINTQNIAHNVAIYRFFDCNTPWAKLFNRNVINRIGLRFRPDLTLREDIVFVYTYRIQITTIKLIAASAYCYRQAENRISLSHKKIHPHYVFLVLREQLPPLIKQVLQKFNIMETEYAQRVYSYNKNQSCISIVKSLYANNVNRKERLSVLRLVFNDNNYFNDRYFKEKSSLKLIRRLQHIFSAPVVDCLYYPLLRSYYRYFRK